jgi:hypothetical protein
VRIGGNKWLLQVAEQSGKFIPREYRKDGEGARKHKGAAAAPAADETAAPAEGSEAVAS